MYFVGQLSINPAPQVIYFLKGINNWKILRYPHKHYMKNLIIHTTLKLITRSLWQAIIVLLNVCLKLTSVQMGS